MGILSNLEPKSVFYYFEEICAIPHGSGDTKAISDYCVRFAKEHQLRYCQDELNNVIIFKDGSVGYEASEPVILQGHLDMVCEKEEGCDIDFTKEGLRLQLADGIVSAQGTTLGGDDGIAVAYMLAVLASDEIAHPPIEAIFTVDEEVGMLGAAALDVSMLRAKTMLNIDSEEEGCLLTSCAGGVCATSHFPVEWEKKEGYQLTLTVSGLLGGHSGVEIDKGRANACTLLGRTLYLLGKELTYQVISVEGGLKDNAIPRAASAQLCVKDKATLDLMNNLLKQYTQMYRKEYMQTDDDILLTMIADEDRSVAEVLTEDSKKRILAALLNLPNGIQRMSRDIEGLVQTSLNLGILKTDRDGITCSFAVRSSVETEKTELTDKITVLTEALGGTVSLSGDYPAWEYRKDSRLRDLMTEVYREQYGKEPTIEAIHAGLECGIFAGKLPELDCISYGPEMKDIHTPQERMYVDSVLRTWNLTLEVLKRLK